MMNLEPVIKWSGSKRSQAAEIIRRFPREIDTYYEPFCGGASVLRRLLMTQSVHVNRYVCSDKNWDLIELWKYIKLEPDYLAHGYRGMWLQLNKDDNLDRKKKYFAEKREEFNEIRNPDIFLFLMRTTTNGMPRYNARGDFNNSFHVTRNGIEPSRMDEILHAWSVALNHHNVEFVCRSYDDVSFKPTGNDMVYADPPYGATKGMYYGGIDTKQFFAWLRSLKCKWALSFDGKAGGEDLTYDVPKDLYVRHEYLASGNSSFRRVIGKNRHAEVFESLYLNYAPVIDERKRTQEELSL